MAGDREHYIPQFLQRGFVVRKTEVGVRRLRA
jgi:hypothetical protein